MTTARNTQISLSDTAWYHCVNRCVRRAYLCGEDHHSGASYEHRRGWIRDRILELADVFAIDVAGYAVMSNHYHVILHVDTVRAEGWSEEEVLVRWCRLFRGGLLVQRYLSEERSEMDAAEVLRVMEYAAEWRGRLIDISWYMRTLNEYIAREANREDGVKGRFWEGRFKSQALLDEQALLTALAYVISIRSGPGLLRRRRVLTIPRSRSGLPGWLGRRVCWVRKVRGRRMRWPSRRSQRRR